MPVTLAKVTGIFIRRNQVRVKSEAAARKESPCY